jgi:transcriptional regulator with XRE-family HTH domain
MNHPPILSHTVNIPEFHKKEIFTRFEYESIPVMARSQRDIAYRLELTRVALGVTTPEFCKSTGMSANQWSQYIDPKGKRRITVEVAYRLKDEYGITLEWIYDGDRNRLPVDLLEKIRATEGLGTVDLSRTRGRKIRIKPPNV